MDQEEHTHVGGTSSGAAAKRVVSGDLYTTKITVDGNVTYIALAIPGSLQSEPVWQVKKIDATTGVVITWAGGTSKFNQVATDLTALSYS